MQQQRKVQRLLTATGLLPVLLLLSAGCNKPADSEGTAAATTPAPAAGANPAKGSPVQQIQSNPAIPQQAKAAIMAHMQAQQHGPPK